MIAGAAARPASVGGGPEAGRVGLGQSVSVG